MKDCFLQDRPAGESRPSDYSRRRFLQSTALAATVPASHARGRQTFRASEPAGQNLYWGDLHTHTYLSDGNGQPEENFEIARSHLDFWAMTDHAYDPAVFSLDYSKYKDPQRLINKQWKRIQEMCRSFEAPGKFIPFLGYEWTNFLYGHHNVYYLQYDQPIRTPTTLPELYAAMKGVDALVIPHHTAYPVGICGKDWSFHDERLSPFAEVYSLHGSSEMPEGLEPILTTGSWMGPGTGDGCVQAGLARGHKLGIMASTDSHLDHPGAYDLGLIGVYADELSRPSLWDSFKKRRIFAVTGDRIRLDFTLNGQPMGGVLRGAGGRRILRISAAAWDRISRVEVVKNNKVIQTFAEPIGPAPTGGRIRFRFRVEWGWDARSEHKWDGSLTLSEGKILKAVPCFRGSADDRKGTGIGALSERRCAWSSKTEKARYDGQCRRYGDLMAFEVECPEQDRLEFEMTCDALKQTLRLSPREILDKSTVRFMENIPVTNDGNYWADMKFCSKFKLHRGWSNEQLSINLNFEDGGGRRGNARTDYYYVRLIQSNGQKAWSSPIWVENG